MVPEQEQRANPCDLLALLTTTCFASPPESSSDWGRALQGQAPAHREGITSEGLVSGKGKGREEGKMSEIQDLQVTFSNTPFPALILLQGGCAGPRTRGLQPQHLCHCRGQPRGCRQLRQGPRERC